MPSFSSLERMAFSDTPDLAYHGRKSLTDVLKDK
jgi:hypothetical protein